MSEYLTIFLSGVFLGLLIKFLYDVRAEYQIPPEKKKNTPEWWTTYFDDQSLDSPEELILFVQDNAAELYNLFIRKVKSDD